MSNQVPQIAPVDDGSGVTRIAHNPEDVQHDITEQEVGEYKEQDRFLPIANVARIMKNSVPDSAKIAKDAKETVQECVSEFIAFITSEAAEKCLLDKRKTIGGEDVLHAMQSLGFDNYAETLKIYLAKLRVYHAQTSEANAAGSRNRSKKKQRLESDGEQDGDDEGEELGHDHDTEGEQDHDYDTQNYDEDP